MTAATTTKSGQHLIEKLVLGLPVATGETTLPVKGILNYAGVTSANPTDFTAVANASALTTADITCTGVAVGDVVIGFGVVSGLATNQYVVGCYVSATDTVRLIIGNLFNSSVTTTAVVVNVLVADVT